MHGFRDACMHEMYGCQPAICALAVANMARTVKMGWLPGARMGVSAARAQGPGQGGYYCHVQRARARLQIDISQNSDTPVPNCGKNGDPTCTCIINERCG